MPYIIKVFDWSAETLRDFFNKGEYFLHFGSIPDVTVSTKCYAPGSCFRAQRCFQAFCEERSKYKLNRQNVFDSSCPNESRGTDTIPKNGIMNKSENRYSVVTSRNQAKTAVP